MFINIQSNDRSAGFSLVEVMVACAITSILLAGLASFSMYSARVFAALTNYCQVESSSRLALDLMSQQIRQSRGLVAFSTNSVTVQDTDGANLQFAYDAAQK